MSNAEKAAWLSLAGQLWCGFWFAVSVAAGTGPTLFFLIFYFINLILFWVAMRDVR